MNLSKSEENGLALLTSGDLRVYSVGISTGGMAEIRMVQNSPKRQVIATTLDQKGISFAKQRIVGQGLQSQITVKLEDVSRPLPYKDGSFDFIYARLVLHYLDKKQISVALKELYRILQVRGKLYVVVRSDKCPDANRPDAEFDPITSLTKLRRTDETTGQVDVYSRYFHTEKSISEYVAEAGFEVKGVKSYEEKLFKDFMRTEAAPHTDNVIELIGVKNG